MNDCKYIIGGGIAGLIFCYYNRSFNIITPEVGGQMNNNFQLGPRYLHDIPESRTFLNDLNIKIEPITVKVGYKYDDLIINKHDADFRKKYFMKSRMEKDDKNFDETTMNNNSEEFPALKVDFKEIIKKLNDALKDNIINEKVQDIDTHKKILYCENNSFNYDLLISTMPLPVFLMLSGNKESAAELKSIGVTYVQLKEDFISMDDYDFVYCPGNEIYHRLSKDVSGYIIAEIAGEISKDTLLKSFNEDYINHIFIKNNQIVGGRLNKIINSIMFIGRYGAWDRSWKTEKVIKESISFNKKTHRITWDDYFMKVALLIAERGTCLRKKVGAIIINEKNRIVGIGYNGAPSGMPHCTDEGCIITKDDNGKQHCIRTIHAEENAMLQSGYSNNPSTLYSTVLPCERCLNMAKNLGIKRIVYCEDYNIEDLQQLINKSGISVEKWKN